MKSFKIVISALLMAGLFATACAPKSPTALKVEKGLDELKAAIESNPTDCSKMAAAVRQPAIDVASGMKEAKQKNESLPTTTKLKVAGLTSTFQKLGTCAKSPEMQQVFESLMLSIQ